MKLCLIDGLVSGKTEKASEGLNIMVILTMREEKKKEYESIKLTSQSKM